jgi:hypothetical protein
MMRSLSKEDTARVDAALRWHAQQLRDSLASAQRDIGNLHLAIAGQLRVLLTDERYIALLPVYAAHKNVQLRVWGPYPAGYDTAKSKTIMSFNAVVASPVPVLDSYELSLADYLKTPLGVVPLPDPAGGRPKPGWYTPTQLIKWVANKEGIAHFDLDLPATLGAIKGMLAVHGTASTDELGTFGATDAFALRYSILEIARWTLNAIEQCLQAPSPA